MEREAKPIGLLGATGIGVGAIVGGGVLALAGVAFAATGPSAMVAFGLNGLIALLTALSFAELSSAFPESGGTYAFAKKVLTAEAAFLVGWVVWMASIVAAVLYALGFAAYAGRAATALSTQVFGQAPIWLTGKAGMIALALAATLFYGATLIRRGMGGGQWATVGKVVVFGLLIAGGLWALSRTSVTEVAADLQPFFPGGTMGLFQAMGYTFIALQGFDLVAAVAGEVRDARRNVPRAMLISLGIAVAIYIPFLFVISTVGVPPGSSIAELSRVDPATVVAVAAENYLGSFGYWLVMVAAVLSMLSALHANLLAASRVARTMALDRALPHAMGSLHVSTGTPVRSVAATLAVVVLTLLLVSDVATAGAVSSLVFLISFALAHGINILTRRRGGVGEQAFRVPWFPLAPLVGGLSCLSLAAFQGWAVPKAGWVASIWLGVGFGLYFFLFAKRAKVVDASAEGSQPDLVRLRGRSPLVLVPIAKPTSAAGLAQVAHALAPPMSGRVLLLSVIQPPGMWNRGALEEQLVDVGRILSQSMTISLNAGVTPEWLTTIAASPWTEIGRVARLHRCESLLIGLGELTDESRDPNLENLISTIETNVVILRADESFRLSEVRRVLVPVGGHRDQSRLRARLLSSLQRDGQRQITYQRVLAPNASEGAFRRARQELIDLAHDEVPSECQIELARAPDSTQEVIRTAEDYDLVVLGLKRLGRRRKTFGTFTEQLARSCSTPIVLISQR